MGVTVNFKFKNGQKVRGKLTGMEGTIIDCAVNIYTGKNYFVQALASPGEHPKGWWHPEKDLQLVPKKKK
nr:hypothetical protein CKG001_10400 [Bdellovibrio sp. CKG001]